MAYILVTLVLLPIYWGAISINPAPKNFGPQLTIGLTNFDREIAGLPALKENNTLDEIAQLKAYDMAKTHTFSHVGSDGKHTYDDAPSEGYSFKYYGENLAVLYKTSDEAEQAFMESPEHRDNILNPHYTDIGVGIEKGTYEGVETTYVAVEFGSQ